MIVLDDNIEDHPKFVSLSDAAFALWVRCIGYCRRNLTDGYIPEQAARARARVRNPAQPIKELCAPPVGDPAGKPLWVKVLGGYQVHDYLDWNPSKEKVEHDREVKRAAAARGGQASGRTRAKQAAERSGGRSSPPASTKDEAPCFDSGSPLANPDPIRSDPIRISTEPLVLLQPPGGPSVAAAPAPGSVTDRKWLLAELQKHPALAAVASAEFANALVVGVLAETPKASDVVARAILDAATHSAGLGLTAEALQRKVTGYIKNARRRPAPIVETRCPAPTDEGVADWLEQEQLPSLSSNKGADVALMLAHYAEHGLTSANWRATWTKWAAADKTHPSGPAPGHRPKRQREETFHEAPASFAESLDALNRIRSGLRGAQ